jgi:predicted acyltransferase
MQQLANRANRSDDEGRLALAQSPLPAQDETPSPVGCLESRMSAEPLLVDPSKVSPKPEPTPAGPGRLLSIDALRGFDMFWIIGGDAFFRALGKWYGEPLHAVTEKQLEHVEWEGFVFYDLIFPLFLFLVGVVIPFSIRSHRAKGESKWAMAGRIARRVLLLVALGIVYNGFFRLDFDNLRYAGVLQRIGICYGIAALIVWALGVRGQAIVTVVILLGYWGLMSFVAAPGGTAGDFSKEGNLAGFVDRTYLPGRIYKSYYGFGDNEGFLSTIPAVATALLGALAGQWLLSDRKPWSKVGGLLVAGLTCLAIGALWSLAFPLIKNLWTSSFVLVAGGFSLLLLGLFYAVIDVLGARWLAFPFAVIGANAIIIYVVPSFLDFEHFTRFFLGGAARRSGDLETVVLAGGVLVAQWLFLYVLWRNRIFLRA